MEREDMQPQVLFQGQSADRIVELMMYHMRYTQVRSVDPMEFSELTIWRISQKVDLYKSMSFRILTILVDWNQIANQVVDNLIPSLFLLFRRNLYHVVIKDTHENLNVKVLSPEEMEILCHHVKFLVHLN